MDLHRPLSLVTPTLDGDVLQVLAGGSVALTGREIQRMAGRNSHDGVRRVLDRLVDLGIVDRTSAGRAYMYQLNREHLAAPYIEGIAHVRHELRSRIADAVAAWTVQPAALAIFGSTARDDSGPRSDIDVFILRPAALDPDDDAWSSDLMQLERTIHRWTGNDVRALEMSLDEVAARADEPVLREIVRDGIEIVGTLAPVRAAVRAVS